MIGTAIRNQPFGAIACVGHSRSRSGHTFTPAKSVPRGAKHALTPSLFFEARRVLTAFLVFAFILGAVVCGPAAHQWLEGDTPAGIQLVDSVAKAPSEPSEPASSNAAGLCTGHCAAHASSLPALLAQSVVPIMGRAVWLVVNDQWSQASRPGRLERPPRV